MRLVGGLRDWLKQELGVVEVGQKRTEGAREMIRQDLVQLHFTEDMTLDNKVWRSMIRVEGSQIAKCCRILCGRGSGIASFLPLLTIVIVQFFILLCVLLLLLHLLYIFIFGCYIFLQFCFNNIPFERGFIKNHLSNPQKGRDKVRIHPPFSRPYLWDYTVFVL